MVHGSGNIEPFCVLPSPEKVHRVWEERESLDWWGETQLCLMTCSLIGVWENKGKLQSVGTAAGRPTCRFYFPSFDMHKDKVVKLLFFLKKRRNQIVIDTHPLSLCPRPLTTRHIIPAPTGVLVLPGIPGRPEELGEAEERVRCVSHGFPRALRDGGVRARLPDLELIWNALNLKEERSSVI